ncbi:MAG TPA: hypothetical protein VGC77_05040 [Rhodopseudomonas sp.]|uniref:hypothetical protein n=1 Tax=Rhodopseudomonas sp. TaxID=1078 RepID=UPI002ED99AD5
MMADNDNANSGNKQDQQKSGTDKPWQHPGQSAQSPNQKPTMPDLERWQESETH